MNQDSPPPDGERRTAEPRKPLEENVKSKSTWLRLFFMVVFALIYGIAQLVTAAVVVMQFFHVLLAGVKNEPLQGLGQSLATYTYQLLLYLTFNSEVRPFPFDTLWPTGAPHVTRETIRNGEL